MPHDPPPDDDLEPGSGAIARHWFPPGHATGRAFIGRHEEYRRLCQDALAGRSSWFDCPARFGVGSLVGRVRRDLRFNRRPRVTSTQLELRQVHDTESAATVLLSAFGRLAAQVMRRSNVVAENVGPAFAGTRTEIYLDDKSLQTIRFVVPHDHLAALARINAQLETLSAGRGCRNLLVVRDSQQLPALRGHGELAEALAGLITASQHTTWLFQGYNQDAMRRLFAAPDAPLRACCRRFALRPIDAGVYFQYLRDAAQARWRCFIGRKASAMIFVLTERHPRWLNQLCRRLWSADLPPLIQNVVTEWLAIVRHYDPVVSRELERLSPNQRAVLCCLAETPTAQPRAKSFVRRTRINNASVGEAVRILASLDLIVTDNDGVWRVKDPVMQWALHPRQQLIDDVYAGGRQEF